MERNKISVPFTTAWLRYGCLRKIELPYNGESTEHYRIYNLSRRIFTAPEKWFSGSWCVTGQLVLQSFQRSCTTLSGFRLMRMVGRQKRVRSIGLYSNLPMRHPEASGRFGARATNDGVVWFSNNRESECSRNVVG